MPDTDKAESKPDTTEDPQTDEEHPLDVARREGLRAAPLSQTQHLDTTDGGITDLHRVSPVFEEARQHAVRQGALAADEEYAPDNVVFPDDKDEADRARRHVKAAAAELPEEEGLTRPVSFGQGGEYNRDMVEKDAAARAGAETEATGTNPLSGEDAPKSEDEDKDKDATAKTSSSSTAKTPAKTTSTTRSTASKTASK